MDKLKPYHRSKLNDNGNDASYWTLYEPDKSFNFEMYYVEGETIDIIYDYYDDDVIDNMNN